MPDGSMFFSVAEPPSLLARLQRVGWECAFVLSQDFRERLTAQQLIASLIAARSSPDRIGIANAGAMLALFVSVVAVRP